jgi:hypothetical protein
MIRLFYNHLDAAEELHYRIIDECGGFSNGAVLAALVTAIANLLAGVPAEQRAAATRMTIRAIEAAASEVAHGATTH